MKDQKLAETYMKELIDRYDFFLTVTDICKILKVSRPEVDRLIHIGDIPASKVGKQYRVSTNDFVEWWFQRSKADTKTKQQSLIKFIS